MAKQAKYYVVWKGHQPGVYRTWAEAQAQINGFPGARYQSFSTSSEAQLALKAGPPPLRAASAGAAGPRSGSSGKKVSRALIIPASLSVDAACSGNPGPMEYQGVRTDTKERIFHQSFPLGTNNIGEFLAIVHGLALLQKQGLHHLPIYTDSATALAWVRNKRAKTLLDRNARTQALYEMIDRAEKWLRENRYTNPVLKWETDSWGEIPADFGRK